GQRDHGRDQDDQPRLGPFSDDRGDVAPERLGHNDDVMPITDGVHDHIGVSRQARGVILDGQVWGDSVVTAPAQFCLDEVPVPADVAGSVDECECHHDDGPPFYSTWRRSCQEDAMSTIEDDPTPSTADVTPKGAGLIRSIAHRLSGDTAA